MSFRCAKHFILGTAQLGSDYGVANNAKIHSDLEACEALLSFAYNSGIRTLDTAFAYGASHQVIANYLTRNPDKRFLIHTKVHQNIPVFSSIKEFYITLGAVAIETVYFHSPESATQENLKALCRLREEKIITKIGLSFYNPKEAIPFLENKDITVFQFPFNALNENIRRDSFLEKCKFYNKELNVRSIFMQGVLTIPVKKLPEKFSDLAPYLKKIHRIADGLKISVQELLLRYTHSFEEISSIIIGVDSIDHLQQNLAVYNATPLDREVLDEIACIRAPDTLTDPREWVAKL
jgi:aryl-alcohol dehydrogenase-like predicted oxidoreductase